MQETKPNDIVLPATDRAISRIHCKIIYKYGYFFINFLVLIFKIGFSGLKPIPENFLAFLMMGNSKLAGFYLLI